MKLNAFDSRRTAVCFTIMIILQMALMLVFCIEKESFHVDELWTYGLANSTKRSSLISREDNSEIFEYGTELHSNHFWEYLTVQEGEEFDYASVAANQSTDLHPTLYGIVIHTICSFFPETFSKWLGLSLNLALFPILQIAFYCLAYRLTKSRKTAFMCCLFFGFSSLAINLVTFIRMYVMLIVITLFHMHAAVTVLENNRIGIKDIAALIITAVLGMLTQYYFYVIAFFMTAAICIYYLCKKQIKLMFAYGFTMLASVGAAIAAFPPVIRSLFFSEHGMTNRSILDILDIGYVSSAIIGIYLRAIGYEMFGLSADAVKYIIAGMALILIILILIFYFRTNTEQKKNVLLSIGRNLKSALSRPIGLFTAAAIGYVAVVAAVAPNMQLVAGRYIACTYPIFIIAAAALLKKLLTHFFPKNKQKTMRIAAISVAVCSFCSIFIGEHIFIYPSPEFNNAESREYFSGKTVLLIPRHLSQMPGMTIVMGDAETVYLTELRINSIIKAVDEMYDKDVRLLVSFTEDYEYINFSLSPKGYTITPVFRSVSTFDYTVYELEKSEMNYDAS